MSQIVKVVSEPIDVELYRQWGKHPSCGAYVEFLGCVRNHNEGLSVMKLEYQAYPQMAEKEMKKLVDRIRNITRCVFVHRIGTLDIGDIAVCVLLSSAHRKDAFEACQFLLNGLKSVVPIWKKEFYDTEKSKWIGCKDDCLK